MDYDDEIRTGEILENMISIIDEIYFQLMFVELPDQNKRLINILSDLTNLNLEQVLEKSRIKDW